MTQMMMMNMMMNQNNNQPQQAAGPIIVNNNNNNNNGTGPKQVNHCMHLVCCLGTFGLMFPCWLAACCGCCCHQPCQC